MNATNLLRQDHTELRNFYTQFDKNTDVNKARDLFDKIAMMIEWHTTIEEDVFYPEVEKMPGLKDLVVEARKEHGTVKGLLRELRGMKGTDTNFKTKFNTMWTGLEHHLDEEEREMFPKFEKACAKDQQDLIGKRLDDRRNQVRQRKATVPV